MRPYAFAPPLFRLVWRLGIPLRPPLYQKFSVLALQFGVFWTIGMWPALYLIFKAAGTFLVWVSQYQQIRPDRELLAMTGLAAVTSGPVAGVAVALKFRAMARRLRLPPLGADEAAA